MKLKQAEVERIATDYAKSIGLAPFVVDGSDFDESDPDQIWRVYLSFCESAGIGLPDSAVIRVNDVTGMASHIQAL
jgi:hypothetical protein